MADKTVTTEAGEVARKETEEAESRTGDEQDSAIPDPDGKPAMGDSVDNTAGITGASRRTTVGYWTRTTATPKLTRKDSFRTEWMIQDLVHFSLGKLSTILRATDGKKSRKLRKLSLQKKRKKLALLKTVRTPAKPI